MQVCHVRCLGMVPYQQAWDLQAQLAGQIATGELPPTLLLLEHPHTFTFGRRGQAANLLWGEAELKQRGVQVYWVDRGGDVTYHGPGQLVGYPLIPLKSSGLVNSTHSGMSSLPQADYVGYLRQLEQVLIQALQTFGIGACRIQNLTGVWVDGAKIAAIGVKVDARGITRHGFALNVDPDMTYWNGIIGCGLGGHSVTSLADHLKESPSMPQVMQAVIMAFEDVFKFTCQVT
ncbi:MAG TPA: lipoyl(octanoyl) transferase LipB [Anaerolineales bacterium]|nr:lipoyl(octanoyl) transferase LipB [Anaerolineales bacterium]